MGAEHPNLRAAMDFSLTTPGERHAGLRVAAHTFYFWHSSGLIHEGRYWLDRALAANPEPTAARLEALAASSWIAMVQGNLQVAESDAGQCLRVSLRLQHPLGDLLGMAGSIERLAWAVARTGAYAYAATLMGAAHQLWQATGQMLFGAARWLRGHEECDARTRKALRDAAYERASSAAPPCR